MTRVERRCRQLLWAWPYRDRLERGDELVGTMLDCVGDGRSWPSLHLAIDMILGGLSARRRRRPPWLTWLGYQFNGRLEYRWHQWLLDQWLAPGWRRRFITTRSGWMLFSYLWTVSIAGIPPMFWAIVYAALLPVGSLILFLLAGRQRNKVLRRHGYSLDGPSVGVTSSLIWVRKSEQLPNLRVSLVAMGASLPLIGAGIVSLAEWPQLPPGTMFARYELPVAYTMVVVLVGLALVWNRVRGIPIGTAGAPARSSVFVAVVAAGLMAAAILYFRAGMPLGGSGLAAGLLGLASALLACALTRHEHRLGRHIGVWDVVPNSGPRTALVPGDVGRWYPPAPG